MCNTNQIRREKKNKTFKCTRKILQRQDTSTGITCFEILLLSFRIASFVQMSFHWLKFIINWMHDKEMSLISSSFHGVHHVLQNVSTSNPHHPSPSTQTRAKDNLYPPPPTLFSDYDTSDHSTINVRKLVFAGTSGIINSVSILQHIPHLVWHY